MPLPHLDQEQRRAGLQAAAEARRVRAELKQMLKTGELTLREALERAETSPALAKTKVSDVIAALPQFGKARSQLVMEELGIAPSRRVQGLGPNQREALLDRFDPPR